MTAISEGNKGYIIGNAIKTSDGFTIIPKDNATKWYPKEFNVEIKPTILPSGEEVIYVPDSFILTDNT